MTTRRLGALCVVVTLAWWVMAPDPVRAEVPPVMIDGVPQPIPVDARLVEFSKLPNWRNAMREALSGRCERILAEIARVEGGRDFNHVFAKAELLDHGLCLDFDPVAAYAEMQKAERSFPGRVALYRGWKSYYGHGLPKADTETVKQDFLRYLLSISWISLVRSASSPEQVSAAAKAASPEQIAANLDAELLSNLGARPMPPMLAAGVEWLKEQMSDRRKQLALARNMLWGTGTYRDGTPLPNLLSSRDAEALVATLKWLDPNAALLSAQAQMEGRLQSDSTDIFRDLKNAADCLNHQAILYLIRFHITGEHGIWSSRAEAGMWLRVGRSLGMDEGDLAEAVSNTQLPAGSVAYADVPRILSGSRCKL